MATVLIVDDSSLSRRMLRNILEPAGYEVIQAVDGMAALEAYALHHPDVVLLDVTMRGMNGLEVLEKLRSMDPGALVAMATADIQTSTHQLASTAGAVHVFHKPFDAQEIISVLAQILERYER